MELHPLFSACTTWIDPFGASYVPYIIVEPFWYGNRVKLSGGFRFSAALWSTFLVTLAAKPLGLYTVCTCT